MKRNRTAKYHLTLAFQYILILLILATAVASLYLLEDAHLKRTVVLAAAALYPLWGIAHHLEEKNLTADIVMEYLAFTLLIAWTLLTAAA